MLLQIVLYTFMFGTMLMHTKLYVDVKYTHEYIDAAYMSFIMPIICQQKRKVERSER